MGYLFSGHDTHAKSNLSRITFDEDRRTHMVNVIEDLVQGEGVL